MSRKGFPVCWFGTCLMAALLLSITSCSPQSYTSEEGLTGAVAGTAVGAGVGWLIGNELGKKTENVLINAAIGGGVGLLAGAIINERNIQTAREREVVVREARLIGKNQRELDELRRNLDYSSSWGRNERKPWNERYTGEDTHRPFQGETSYKPPKY